MMALLGTILFGGALLLVGQVFFDTLLPAMPRIVALVRDQSVARAVIVTPRPAPRRVIRPVARLNAAA